MYQADINREVMQGIAIEVLKTRRPNALPALKNFLFGLRNPSSIRDVLLSTIQAVIEEDPDLARWLLAQYPLFLPELNLLAIAQQLALKRLQDQGWVQDRDFTFSQDGQLQASKAIKATLLTNLSLHDQLLLEILL